MRGAWSARNGNTYTLVSLFRLKHFLICHLVLASYSLPSYWRLRNWTCYTLEMPAYVHRSNKCGSQSALNRKFSKFPKFHQVQSGRLVQKVYGEASYRKVVEGGRGSRECAQSVGKVAKESEATFRVDLSLTFTRKSERATHRAVRPVKG